MITVIDSLNETVFHPVCLLEKHNTVEMKFPELLDHQYPKEITVNDKEYIFGTHNDDLAVYYQKDWMYS